MPSALDRIALSLVKLVPKNYQDKANQLWPDDYSGTRRPFSFWVTRI
jgi:hypothetical protein